MSKVKLLNYGKRNFIVGGTTFAPNDTIDLDEASAKRLVKLYPGEVKDLGVEEKPEKTMTVAELKEALAEKGIEVPEGAKKAELQALLD